MNNTMTEYINTITGDELDVLEDIIQNHYIKFIDFFYVFQAYSDTIVDIEYKTKSDTALNLSVVFSNTEDANSVYSCIEDNASETDDCKIKSALSDNILKVKFEAVEV